MSSWIVRRLAVGSIAWSDFIRLNNLLNFPQESTTDLLYAAEFVCCCLGVEWKSSVDNREKLDAVLQSAKSHFIKKPRSSNNIGASHRDVSQILINRLVILWP